MKKELVIPLGIAFIAGILIMLAGCGTSNPFNPIPNVQIGNQSTTYASGAATVKFDTNVFGPDIQVYSMTRTVDGLTAAATPVSIGFFHPQPNDGTKPATFTTTYSGITGAAGTHNVTEIYSYYTIPGNVYGTYPVSYSYTF